jgi:hypothetical protein
LTLSVSPVYIPAGKVRDTGEALPTGSHPLGGTSIMRRISVVAVGAAALIALAAGPAAAAGKSGASPGQNKDALIFYYSTLDPTSSPTPSGTVDNLGQAIAGGFFGNTANASATGHGVIPSVSPGPAVGNCSGVVPGSSVGDLITGNPSGPSGQTDPSPC